MQQNQQQENSKMGTKSQKRISVTFSESFNIPDEQGSKSPLSKKNEEALLEQLRVSLGHVECRHAHYPATPPVYRAKEEPPTPPPHHTRRRAPTRCRASSSIN